MSRVDLRPQNTLRSSSFVFQAQQSEPVALPGCFRLEIVDDAADVDARAAGDAGQVKRLCSFRRLQEFAIVSQRMSGDVKTKSGFFGKEKLRTRPGNTGR